MDLIATIGGTSSNSYITVADANSYFELHTSVSTWLAIDSTDKARYLVMATRYLDLMVDWLGSKADSDQSLEWPRSGVTGYDDDELPSKLTSSTCELALHLINKGGLSAEGSTDKIKVGPISIDKKDTGGFDTYLFPPLIASMISTLGVAKGSSTNSLSTSKLVR